MRSIRGKLFIALLFTALISALLIGFFLLSDAERLAENLALEKSRTEMSNLRDYYFEQRIETLEEIVDHWSADPAITGYVPALGQKRIVNGIPMNFANTYRKWLGISESSQDITWLYFGLESDGSIFCAPVDTSMPEDYDSRTRHWYQDAVAHPTEIRWSEPYVDAGNSGKMLQTVSKAVMKNGKLVGVMAIDIEVQRFIEILKSINFSEQAVLSILNDQGQTVACTDPLFGEALGKIVTQRLSEETTEILSVSDDSYVLSIRPFSTNRWTLAGLHPVDLAGNLSNAKSKVYIVLTIHVLLTSLLGMLLTGTYMKPLGKLLSVVDNVTKGDIKSRTNLKTRDELGELSRSFDSMLDNIEEILYERDHHLKILKKKNKEILKGKEEIIAYSSQVEAMNQELSRLLNELGDNYLSTVKALANAIEASDDYTRGHCERVEEISERLGNRLGLTQVQIENLKYACVLHDIGKIAISDKILNKRQPLTKDELSMIKMHPLIGFEIIRDVHFLENASQILLQHHERMDGKGYPYGVAGEDILMEARILSVADAYDAMTSARAYRLQPLGREQVIEELKIGKQAQFDPVVVDALIAMLEQEKDEEQAQII